MQWYVTVSCCPALFLNRPLQNANAYLLFYKRRTSRPLGGKSYARVEAARSNAKAVTNTTFEQAPQRLEHESQLPTPPQEGDDSFAPSKRGPGGILALVRMDTLSRSRLPDWPTPVSNPRSSPASSSSLLDEGDPPSFEDARYDEVVQSSLDPLALSARQFDFPNPSINSPTSSNEAEPDLEPDTDPSWPVTEYQNLLRLRTARFPRSGASSPEGSSTGDYTLQSQSEDDKEDSFVSRDETSRDFSEKYQRMSGNVRMRPWGKPAAVVG
ncbi:hypothetical protein B0H21DRAFT_547104 [Amylocystis lapponica]|nr:hypothetical protein B0H21DRAFT_547104 [Amylocystis lapponica]